MPDPLKSLTCWIVTEGLTGTENQCLGVAQALGVAPVVKRIGLRQPWKTLSPWLGLEQSWSFSEPLMPPWPDLLIASGRKSIAASRYIKKQSGGKTFTAQIQDPRITAARFDLVALPHHDNLRGENVIITDAAPNRITKELLDQARHQFAPLFSSLPSPRVAVLIGGNSKAHKLTEKMTRGLIEQLLSLPASLMITASRRTGEENIRLIKQALAAKNSYFWDGTGNNPYFGMLAWADAMIVTEDSVSMIADAGTTGKPVYVIRLEGGSARFDRFHAHMNRRGVTRPFQGKLESWDYPPLDNSGKVAAEIRKRMGLL